VDRKRRAVFGTRSVSDTAPWCHTPTRTRPRASPAKSSWQLELADAPRHGSSSDRRRWGCCADHPTT
jgi:hypothetical protein